MKIKRSAPLLNWLKLKSLDLWNRHENGLQSCEGVSVFFLGGGGLLESPMGVPNGVPSGVPKKFWVESPKRKVESPMFFKKFSWESPVCFVKMVLDIIFRFPWTHLSSPYHNIFERKNFHTQKLYLKMPSIQVLKGNIKDFTHKWKISIFFREIQFSNLRVVRWWLVYEKVRVWIDLKDDNNHFYIQQIFWVTW